MRRFLSFLLILATLLAICSCGGEAKEPQKQEEAPKPEDPLSKITFFINEKESVPENEHELNEMLAELLAFCDDGRNVNVQVHGAGNGQSELVSGMEENGFSYVDGFDADVSRDWGHGVLNYDLLNTLDGEFLLSLVQMKDIEKIVVTSGEMYKDPDFPEFEVTMHLGSQEVKIHNTRHLQVQLDKLAQACQNGKSYDGMGVYLHGYEVQASDLTGIPYCHISHGSKNEPMTILGFRHDVIGQLDAKLVVDMLSICPYFTSVEFFAADDADKPALNK